MVNQRRTVCISIDRRSSLAILVIFLVTHIKELQYLAGGTVCLALAWAQWSIAAASTRRLEEKWSYLQTQSRELQGDIATLQREIQSLRQQQQYPLMGRGRGS